MSKAAALLILAIYLQQSAPQRSSPRIVLDQDTISAGRRAELQHLADQVVSAVDSLIPGQLNEFEQDRIICFQVTRNSPGDAASDAPITLISRSKLPYEPASTRAGEIRIALYEIEPQYEPDYKEHFIVQLSHELAHVKMGMGIDNDLVETLAVAVSHEVLVHLGMTSYERSLTADRLARLPTEIRVALAADDRPLLKTFWRDRNMKSQLTMEDRANQTLGSVLIRGSAVPWPALLGISRYADCGQATATEGVRMCPPAIVRMGSIRPFLAALGF